VLPLSLFWSYVAIAALIHFFRSLMRWIFSWTASQDNNQSKEKSTPA
jgi:hypothetical protein